MESSVLILDGGVPFGSDRAASFVIADGRIAFSGTAATAAAHSPAARHLDLAGATILPGLVDAHGHLGGLGALFDNVSLIDTVSIEDVRSRIVLRSTQLAPGEWLVGRGWDQNDWAQKAFPTAADLDAVIQDRPVWLERVDGHAGWANSKALELAGITKATPDPSGGLIVRDAAGNPTGVFIDAATALVESKIPATSRERRKSQLVAALRDVARNGLTAVHDPGMDDVAVSILKELADSGELPVRVYVMLTDDAALLEKWFAQGPLINYRNLLTVRAVKLYGDGALGSRGAALLAPYSDAPSNNGLMQTTEEHIADVAARARKSGFQVNTHAIGDRAVRVALDAYARRE